MIRRNDGYIALMSVLIVGAAATAIGLTLLVSGANSQRSALVEQQSIQATALANACGEEALQVLHDNKTYAGTGTLTLSTGTCNYNITNTVTAATITTNSTVNDVVKKNTIYATINATNISITSWQEVI